METKISKGSKIIESIENEIQTEKKRLLECSYLDDSCQDGYGDCGRKM